MHKAALAAALVVTLSCGCARNSNPPELAGPIAHPAASPGTAVLPRLSAIDTSRLAPRSASYVEADLVKNGDQFSGSLYNRHVVSQGSLLQFSPDHAGTQSAFDGLAVAMFVFHLPDFDRKAQLRTVWETVPADSDNVFYALSEWGQDRWKVVPASSDFMIDGASFAPYLNFAGDMILAVIVGGTDQCVLDHVRIGAPLPVAELTVSPAQDNVPVEVTLDASTSAAVEGSIVKYEFDPEGDGSFLDNGINPVLEFEYVAVGAYDAQVRITDSQQAKAVASREVRAMGPWTRTYSRGGTSGGCIVLGVVAAANGDIYACGREMKGAGLQRAAVWKYSAVGELLWARSVGADFESHMHKSCMLDSDGNLYVCGLSLEVGEQFGTLQRWSPDGDVLWSRKLSGATVASLNDLSVLGTDVFAVGQRNDLNGDKNTFAMRVNALGEIVWARMWNTNPGYSGGLYASTLRLSFELGATEIIGAGYWGPQTEEPPVFSPAPMLVAWDENGNLTRSWRLGNGGYNGYLYDVAFSGISPSISRIHVLGEHYNGSRNEAYVVSSTLGGNVQGSAVYSDPGASVSPRAMCPVAGGFLVAAGLTNGVNSFGGLITLDPAAHVESLEWYWDSSSQSDTSFEALTPTVGGMVIGGAVRSDAPPGSRGDMGGSASELILGWEAIEGTSTELNITLEDSRLDSEPITDGVVDDASEESSAMVRYEPFP